MYMFVLIIHIIASLVLVAVILLQAGRGGGLAETFGGGGSAFTTIFGQKMSSFLTKATAVCAVLFLCTSLTLAALSSRRAESLMGKRVTLPIRTEEGFVPETKPVEVEIPEETLAE